MTIITKEGDNFYTLASKKREVWLTEHEFNQHMRDNNFFNRALVDGKQQWWFRGDL